MPISTLDEFRQSHPEFVDVCDDDIEIFLGLSSTYVNECWGDNMQRGSALFAAHYAKLKADADAVVTAGGIVRSISSGSHKVDFFENRVATSGLGEAAGIDTTIYGQLFAQMKARYTRFVVQAV